MTNTYAIRGLHSELNVTVRPTTSTENLHKVFREWHPILTTDWRNRLSQCDLADFNDNMKKNQQNSECSVWQRECPTCAIEHQWSILRSHQLWLPDFTVETGCAKHCGIGRPLLQLQSRLSEVGKTTTTVFMEMNKCYSRVNNNTLYDMTYHF